MTGIWRHARLFEDGGEPASRASEHGWSLGEGDTPLQELPGLAEQLGVGRLLLKREDLNPSGSHKDRGLLYQVVRHRGELPGTFVLSSSGNAAVAAAAACRITGDRLVAFVSPVTSAAKQARLLATDAVVVRTERPINFGRYAARVFGLNDLRGTKDPVASVGYRSIAAELESAEPAIDAVFTFSSSGVSMEGIADGFERLSTSPALWSVQSGECIGIVRALTPEAQPDPESPAGRLGIRNPPGAEALAGRLQATGGGALAVTGAELAPWARALEAQGVEVSPEGAAVLAGIAATDDLSSATVVAVMTGAAAPAPGASSQQQAIELDSYLDVRSFFCERLGLEPS